MAAVTLGAFSIHCRQRSNFAARGLALAALLLAGALVVELRPAAKAADPAMAAFEDGREVTITGHVIKEGILRPGNSRQMLDVETEEIVAGGEAARVGAGIRVNLY